MQFTPQNCLKTGWRLAEVHWRCALLCYANKKRLVTFLFWIATKTNYMSKCMDFQKKLINTFTTSNSNLKFKENNENDMAALVFWPVFYSSQIHPTSDFDGAAITSPIFSMLKPGWRLAENWLKTSWRPAEPILRPAEDWQRNSWISSDFYTHYHLQVQANPKKIVQKNRCYF